MLSWPELSIVGIKASSASIVMASADDLALVGVLVSTGILASTDVLVSVDVLELAAILASADELASANSWYHQKAWFRRMTYVVSGDLLALSLASFTTCSFLIIIYHI